MKYLRDKIDSPSFPIIERTVLVKGNLSTELTG
jgi:hypothetical protein